MGDFRSAPGKRLLAMARSGDYAHAGEEEAIALALAPLAPDPNRRVLDLGCGLGGTADYMRRRGLGRIEGCDIDADGIAHARAMYPLVPFRVVDATALHDAYPADSFDLITLFNVYYGLPNQGRALVGIRRILAPGGTAVIFDYTSDGETPYTAELNAGRPFRPIRLAEFKAEAESCGLTISQQLDLTDRYDAWYAAFVAKIVAARPAIVAEFGEPRYEEALDFYSRMHREIVEHRLGGVLLYLK